MLDKYVFKVYDPFSMTPDNRRPGIPISRKALFAGLGTAALGVVIPEVPKPVAHPPTLAAAIDTATTVFHAAPTEAILTGTEDPVITDSDIKGITIFFMDSQVKTSLLTPNKQSVGNYDVEEDDPTLMGNARIFRIDGDPTFTYRIDLDECLLSEDTADHISVRASFWGIGTQPVDGRRDLNSNQICTIMSKQKRSGLTLFVSKPSIKPEDFINVIPNVIPTTQVLAKPTHILDAFPTIFVDFYAKTGDRTSSIWFQGKDLVNFPKP